MNPASCICVVCQRTVKTIRGAVENREKVSPNTKIDVLYVDSKNRLVCDLCITEYTLVLKYLGEPVYTVYPYEGRTEINQEAFSKAIKSPLQGEEEEFFYTPNV